MREKETLLVIFGGRSTEHEVSCRSVQNIARDVDRERYELVLLGITKEGEWRLAEDLSSIEDGSWREGKRAMLLPDASLRSLLIFEKDGSSRLQRIDVIFPALHGKYGEDGSIQGLFELSGIPYVGSGVLASAVSMDKLFTKVIAAQPLKKLGLRQARCLPVDAAELGRMEEILNRVEKSFQYPVFVKPANAGSSCGVSRVEKREELPDALRAAAKVDRKLLVEETVYGRELECALLRGPDMKIHASGLGEIRAAASFYDYDAKYNNPDSVTDVNPELDAENAELIRSAAKAIFAAVDGYGLARVDFFLTEDGPVFNEINTLPGFTAISMYPMLWEAKGIGKRELIQRLIDSACQRPGSSL
ncbi:D-ala D-ala ligase N-terminal domain protein [Oribacterium sp. oral taxon 078 str. F0262]|uniref:D-alanine--D-alanine ligase family protein n=1 Tax=Oribacterium sp. oral taxon 078 TaxID=652706 RepID=UPI0001BCC426|nr:D-alanine--D-alanine ligase family protein [Oribacterium sp. oral taxon 078]EFE90993.1 D-ala D-ala ligase N-terminal domain protein [Oribacterium sp. oral taxon 078 str. F0262]